MLKRTRPQKTISLLAILAISPLLPLAAAKRAVNPAPVHPQVAVTTWAAPFSVSRIFSYRAMTNAWTTLARRHRQVVLATLVALATQAALAT